MSARRPPRRRLPPEYVALHPDLGERLRKAREGPKGERFGHKQEMLADEAGVSRSTLSRIEQGHAVPRMETLERLMAALDIESSIIAEVTRVEHPVVETDASQRMAKDATLGGELRAERTRLGLTIAEVALAAGVSAAQLSRIERGQIRFSRLTGWYAGHMGLEEEYRDRVFTNPVLGELLRGIWPPDSKR